MATRMIVAAGVSVQAGVTSLHVTSGTGNIMFQIAVPGDATFKFVALPDVLSGDTARYEAAKYLRTLPEFKPYFKFLDEFIKDKTPVVRGDRPGRKPKAVAEPAPEPVKAAPKAAGNKKAVAPKADKKAAPKAGAAAEKTPVTADRSAKKALTLQKIKDVAAKVAAATKAEDVVPTETPVDNTSTAA